MGANKNLFIVVEGEDGSGKDTQLDLLMNYYRKKPKQNHTLPENPKYDLDSFKNTLLEILIDYYQDSKSNNSRYSELNRDHTLDIDKLIDYYHTTFKENKVLLTAEPTMSDEGKVALDLIENTPKDRLNEIAEQTLNYFIKDRELHLKELVVPAYNLNLSGRNRIVILCGRYVTSGAYQLNQGVPLANIVEPQKNFLSPDVTFFIEVSPEERLRRMKERGTEPNAIEKNLEFNKQLKKCYDEIITSFPHHNIHRIDGIGTKEEVHERILYTLKTLKMD